MQLQVIKLKKCKKVLEKNGEKYTDEQVKQISDLLKQFASLTINEYLKSKHDEKSHNNNESI